MCFCFFKQKTAYEMRISDWSSDVCSSDLLEIALRLVLAQEVVERAGVELRIAGTEPLAGVGQVVAGRGAELALPLVGQASEPLLHRGHVDVQAAQRTGPVPAPAGLLDLQLGSASWRERVCRYV